MHKFGGLVLIAALALTGCATTPQPGTPVGEKQSKSSATVEPAPTLEAAPTEPAATAAEDLYYESVVKLAGLESTPREEALQVGSYVCEQLDAGVPPLSIDMVPNADEFTNDRIVLYAALLLCTQHGEAVQQMVIDKAY